MTAMRKEIDKKVLAITHVWQKLGGIVQLDNYKINYNFVAV